MTAKRSRANVYLRLGRVSNLPTVWSNVLCGVILAGARPHAATAWLSLAMSLFYVGGMFLNDAFDRHIDALDRPDRPIPAGEISAKEVFLAGFTLLAAGLMVLVWTADPASLLGGLALAGAIVLYDYWHKSNPLSPVLMALCRLLVYLTAALAATGDVPANVWGGGLLLASYLIGLTYAAKQENLLRPGNLWPLLFLFTPLAWAALPAFSTTVGMLLFVLLFAWVVMAVSLLRTRKKGAIPLAVMSLIAGISLLDALLIAVHGGALIAPWVALAWGLTLLLQRWVRGT